MKTKCKVCTVMCDISRGKELRTCAFEHHGDENICPFDARYLDLSEHDKQIRTDAIDEFCNVLCSNGAIADFMKDYIIEKGKEFKQILKWVALFKVENLNSF